MSDSEGRENNSESENDTEGHVQPCSAGETHIQPNREGGTHGWTAPLLVLSCVCVSAVVGGYVGGVSL